MAITVPTSPRPTSPVAFIRLVCFVVSSFGFYWFLSLSQKSRTSVFGSDTKSPEVYSRDLDAVLSILRDQGVYNNTEFVNKVGVEVPYWSENKSENTGIPEDTTTSEWGPCFGPHSNVRWQTETEKYFGRHASYNQITDGTSRVGNNGNAVNQHTEDWANYCRPGFLIIGAGKCGTSSLYHYLTDHPRVLPASEKQIHYFKYYAKRSMKWYLHHFPTATSFLASGALITGEASPGYLPYPYVATMVRERLPNGPRIIAIGREPVDRAYSSYRYNYVTPTMESLMSGKVKDIPKGKNASFYDQYLFSFEEMMRAELKTLRECLSVPNGQGVSGAAQKWGSGFSEHYDAEYKRREESGLDPMVDLDLFCYGAKVNSDIPRPQWTELMTQYPEKVIEERNVHLKQSMIGRGLYTLPLEWWYAVFEPKDVYFVCTEELSDMTGDPMNHLGQFLGLPSFNFSETVSGGAYNVGGHRGYDKEISWSEIEKVKQEMAIESRDETKSDIPLSAVFRRELEEFIQPYNERLFKLVGRRCDW